MVAPSRGRHVLPGAVQNEFSSVQTHGNTLRLWDWNHQTNGWDVIIDVPPWKVWNLQGYQQDRADAATVYC